MGWIRPVYRERGFFVLGLRSQARPVQFSSVAQLFPTLCDPIDCSSQASLSITTSRSLFKLMSVQSVMPSNHLILCRPLHLPPSIFPSIRGFSNESALCVVWPKYWSFSFNIKASLTPPPPSPAAVFRLNSRPVVSFQPSFSHHLPLSEI